MTRILTNDDRSAVTFWLPKSAHRRDLSQRAASDGPGLMTYNYGT